MIFSTYICYKVPKISKNPDAVKFLLLRTLKSTISIKLYLIQETDPSRLILQSYLLIHPTKQS